MIGKRLNALMECKDLKATRSFYTTNLDMRVSDQGDGWIVLDGGGTNIIAWQGGQPGTMLGFSGVNLAQARTALEAQGVAISATMEHPGGKHFEIADPDGNRIMISDK